jgi:[ribosomal protein S5]-alanine N-acetyltransferase
MQHLGTTLIETDRLVLRRFTMDDAAAVYRNWASDAEVTRYLTWPTHSCVEDSSSILREWVEQYQDFGFYQWAITLKELGDEPVGSIAVVHKDDKIGMVHIGYCIGKKWWHQGITSEALAALIRFFFTEVAVSRIESRHDPRNANSGRVMLSCGMKCEGTMIKADWNNQGICDASCYAILAGEWRKTDAG